MRRWIVRLLLGLWLLPQPTNAQFQLPVEIPFLGAPAGLPVYDEGNHVANIVTAIQSLFIQANQIVNLLPFEELALPEDRPSEWLGLIIDFVCHPPSFELYLSFRLDDICGTLGRIYPPPDRIPQNSTEFAEWQAAKLEQTRLSTWDAIKAQALVETMELDVEHLVSLLNTLLSAVGNLQGHQTAPQFTAQQLLQQMRGQVIQATYYRAQTSRLADEVTTIQALRNINKNLWSGWPGMPEE